jgi:hypothetical protein
MRPPTAITTIWSRAAESDAFLTHVASVDFPYADYPLNVTVPINPRVNRQKA